MVIRMIRAMVGFFTVMTSIDAMEQYGSVLIGVLGCAVGLALFTWPVVTGYFKVSPESYYVRKDG
jgi:hypothetical protein